MHDLPSSREVSRICKASRKKNLLSAAGTRPGGFDFCLDPLWSVYLIFKKQMNLWAETPSGRAVFFLRLFSVEIPSFSAETAFFFRLFSSKNQLLAPSVKLFIKNFEFLDSVVVRGYILPCMCKKVWKRDTKGAL
ncbi:hypothetical protein Dace_0897 [Desulfuromonas acetoxidans DSM 684]|uniref:Uncharacterized protein n=1 Tax=Desulfuromonas acetoxidans (strain DSM 684 / 11070) TaxID=281689 RepID=Q1JXA4_DESA6|nr:hypothetical protein Dace_0897 [Desulfuromonas acetoxidans DSM 684]